MTSSPEVTSKVVYEWNMEGKNNLPAEGLMFKSQPRLIWHRFSFTPITRECWQLCLWRVQCPTVVPAIVLARHRNVCPISSPPCHDSNPSTDMSPNGRL